MKIRIGEIILLHITILFNQIHVKVAAMNITHLPTSHIPTPTHTLPSIWNSMSIVFPMPTHISHGNQTHIGVSSKILVIPSSSMSIIASHIKTANPMPKSSSVSKVISTSIWSASSIISKSPSTSHPLLPSMPYPTSNTTSPPSPTHKPPKTTSSSQPFVHKVGLIVGIVLGLVLLSVCLIAFHKKETRIKCLKLMCRPCTKNYRSRYNIVPIYVYDDAEQDIRELQDDSDLPLV